MATPDGLLRRTVFTTVLVEVLMTLTLLEPSLSRRRRSRWG